MKKEFDENAAIAIAKDINTSTGVLETIIGRSAKVDKLVANHPNADDFVLVSLSESKSKITRRNVFFNPNARVSTIAKLMSEFSQDLLRLTEIDAKFSEDPEYVYRIGQKNLSDILKDPLCPLALLDWACEFGGSYEQLSVWINPATPEVMLTKLMASGFCQEANVLLAHPEKMLEFTRDLGFIGNAPDNYTTKEYGRYLLTRDETMVIVRRNKCIENLSNKYDELWKTLVPESGPAETLQGEVLRAIGQLENEYGGMGFSNWGGYYDNFARFIATHLADKNIFCTYTVNVILSDIRALLSYALSFLYKLGVVDKKPEYQNEILLNSVTDMDQIFERLHAVSVVWCERHPEPIPYKPSKI
ncbi:MAG: hypothetical protein HOO97_05465 [Sideroxydans sp.]|nr:hypothetical protein [Sideroxydans sp.]